MLIECIVIESLRAKGGSVLLHHKEDFEAGSAWSSLATREIHTETS